MNNPENDSKEKFFDHNGLKYVLEAQKNIGLDRGVEDVFYFYIY